MVQTSGKFLQNSISRKNKHVNVQKQGRGENTPKDYPTMEQRQQKKGKKTTLSYFCYTEDMLKQLKQHMSRANERLSQKHQRKPAGRPLYLARKATRSNTSSIMHMCANAWKRWGRKHPSKP